MRESVSVLQVMQEPVSGTESATKLKVRMIKPLSHIVPIYTRKRYHSFVAIGIVTCAVHSKQYRWQQTCGIQVQVQLCTTVIFIYIIMDALTI